MKQKKENLLNIFAVENFNEFMKQTTKLNTHTQNNEVKSLTH